MKLSLFFAFSVILMMTACHTSKATKNLSSENTPAPPAPVQVVQANEKPIDPNNPVKKSEDETTFDCFDKTFAQPDVICDEDNRPVCGCNNVNYKNACEAQKVGVRYYSWGKCPKTTKTGPK